MSDSISMIKENISGLTDALANIFNISLEKAFIASTYILSQNELPYFKNLSEEENNIIVHYYDNFKKISYTGSEMRRAFSESYLLSLREIENYTVNVTLELPLIYLVALSDLIISNFNYSEINVLNASGNNGNLALALYLAEHINKTNLSVTVNNEDELRIATNLRDLAKGEYDISSSAKELSYRCDLIVSDPFLKTAEDILVFFEENLEYLNNEGFFITVLPTQFVRSRIFSDLVNDHSLLLIGLIEYPKDLLEGLISSSIVILEKNHKDNKEFFHSMMPSVKDIDSNIKVLNEIKKYIKDYFEGN